MPVVGHIKLDSFDFNKSFTFIEVTLVGCVVEFSPAELVAFIDSDEGGVVDGVGGLASIEQFLVQWIALERFDAFLLYLFVRSLFFREECFLLSLGLFF